MKIAVLGTGMVGRSLAGRLAEVGNEVSIGTRDVDATLARTQPDAMGNPAYRVWAAEHPEVELQTFSDAAARADLIVNATSGASSISALTDAGPANLAGKVVIDVANPLDFSKGFPPSLFVKDTDSLGEQIQREFPSARVVKALNTMTADLMIDPRQLANGDHTTFICGDDPAAKSEVVALLESLGHKDVIDLGDLSAARGAEMLLPVWLRLMGALNTRFFNFKIVR